MNENYTDEVKAIIEAAQQQALMNYNQEVTSAHLLLALCSDDFFKFLLQTFKVDENTFAGEARAPKSGAGQCDGRPLGFCVGQRWKQ